MPCLAWPDLQGEIATALSEDKGLKVLVKIVENVVNNASNKQQVGVLVVDALCLPSVAWVALLSSRVHHAAIAAIGVCFLVRR